MMIFPLVFMRENGGAGELSGGSAWDAAEAGCGDWVAAVVVMIAAAAAVVVAVLRWKKVRLPIGLLWWRRALALEVECTNLPLLLRALLSCS